MVAHDGAQRCREEMGGIGSMIICPSVVGEMHLADGDRKAMPFMIGDVDPAHGYVHVLDDTTVQIPLP